MLFLKNKDLDECIVIIDKNQGPFPLRQVLSRQLYPPQA
jgi:hypothetical protein